MDLLERNLLGHSLPGRNLLGHNAGTAEDRASLLGIYVNDHRAGAAAGLALARRSQRNNQGSALGDELERIVHDLEVDAATLTAIAEHLSVSENFVKSVLSRAGELVSRLKLNDRLHGYSPLSRHLELEGLLAGIDAKRSLWRSLYESCRSDLSEFDFEALEQRATDQRTRLIPFHRAAARSAFGAAVPTAAPGDVA